MTGKIRLAAITRITRMSKCTISYHNFVVFTL